MSVGSSHKSRSRGAARRTRTERRTAERTARKQQVRRRQPRIPVSALVGGAVTLAALVAILAYALIRSSPAQSNQALTSPNDLNPSSSTLNVGATAPNFTLHDVSGNPFTLSAQRDHPVLLEFFAVWCPHCQAEAPTIARLTRAFSPHGVRVWSVLASPYGRNYDNSGGTDLRPANKGDLQWFAQTFNVRHPQLVDPHFRVVNRYGLPGYPTIFVIDGKGRIAYAESGEVSYSALAGALQKALHGGSR